MGNKPPPLKPVVIGSGAIRGMTAARLKKAGRLPILVCRRLAIVDRIRDHGPIIRGSKGRHRILLTAVQVIREGSRLNSIANLDGPVFNGL